MLAPLVLRHVSVRRGAVLALADVTLQVGPGERWLVLGANGSGKTTLVRVAGCWDHPTTGTVEVLGERLGLVDVRRLRRRIGFLSAALADRLRPELSALDIVRTARFAALEPWWHRYDATDDAAAAAALERVGVAPFAARSFGSLSSGERQRVLLARALANDPSILLLDEPGARLDLAGREQLVAALDAIASGPDPLPLVLVSHHVEDVPASMTHVALLKAGCLLASGPIDEVLDADALSECFGLELQLERRAGRLSAHRR
ncbi:MAG: ABC transporter ATP-binding protein [Ilumatobacteraceae bacterium]